MKDRFVIYTRVSTDKQVEGTSLETQEERCILSIKARFGQVEASQIEVIQDAGSSGSNLERQGIKRIFSLIEEGLVDYLVFFALDRLSRKQLDLLNMLKIFQDKQIKILSVQEPALDTTNPMGNFFISLISGIAELERETIKERVSRGLQKIKERGRFAGGVIPFGYVSERNVDGGLQIVDHEARIIRSIFYYRSRKKLGYLKIANSLNARGFLKRDGKPWTAKSIQRILQHKEFYEGKIALHKDQSITKHPPILK
jgi:site-specific DNA recombinase